MVYRIASWQKKKQNKRKKEKKTFCARCLKLITLIRHRERRLCLTVEYLKYSCDPETDKTQTNGLISLMWPSSEKW